MRVNEMRELSILQEQSSRTAKPGFWRRQFAQEVTRPQVVYDIVLGIIGPILCFVFDPIVFRSGFLGAPVAPELQVLVYSFSGLEITILALWLCSGATFRSLNGLIAGVLISGGIFCLLLGLVLIPLSTMGLAFGIGLFGFTPFFTAIVYLRNGFRAWHSQQAEITRMVSGVSWLIGACLVICLPVILDQQLRSFIRSTVDQVIKGDSQRAVLAAQGLRPLRFLASSELDRIAQAYLNEPDASRKEHLKACYREITGEDVETRIRIMQD